VDFKILKYIMQASSPKFIRQTGDALYFQSIESDPFDCRACPTNGSDGGFARCARTI